MCIILVVLVVLVVVLYRRICVRRRVRCVSCGVVRRQVQVDRTVMARARDREMMVRRRRMPL